MNQSHTFDFSLFGYNRQQVDRLVKEQADKITELESKLEADENRLSELEEKVAYYVEIEKDLTDGVLDARKAGNHIVAESNDKAEKLILQTNEQVAQYKEDVALYSRQLTTTGKSLKTQLNSMKSEMETILKEYQAVIEATDFDRLFPADKIDQFSYQIDEYMRDDLSMNTNDSRINWADNNSLSDDEKKELEKLIQEVIANEVKPAHSAKNEEDEKTQTEKLVRLVSNKMN